MSTSGGAAAAPTDVVSSAAPTNVVSSAAPTNVVSSAAPGGDNAPAKRTRPSGPDAASTKVPRLSTRVLKLLRLLPDAKAVDGRVVMVYTRCHGELGLLFIVMSGEL